MNVEDFAKGLAESPDFLWQDLDLVNRRRLQAAIDGMRQQGHGDGSSSVFELCTKTAKKVMGKLGARG